MQCLSLRMRQVCQKLGLDIARADLRLAKHVFTLFGKYNGVRTPVGRVRLTRCGAQSFEMIDNVDNRASVHVDQFAEPRLAKRLFLLNGLERTQLRRRKAKRTKRHYGHCPDTHRGLIEQIADPAGLGIGFQKRFNFVDDTDYHIC